MSILTYSAEPMIANKQRSMFLSIVTLAIWRIRQTWGMLLLTGIGVLVAVTLTCAIPLYAQVSERVGFSRLWSVSAENATIIVQSRTPTVSATLIRSEEQQVDAFTRQDIGDYLAAPFQVSLQTASMSVLANASAGDIGSAADYSGNVLSLSAYAMDRAGSHVAMRQGHLPRANSSAIEIAVTAATAQHLHVNVGSTIAVKLAFQAVTAGDASQSQLLLQSLALHVVGIFSTTRQDVYWHGSNFESTQTGVFSALTDNDALLNGLSRIADHSHVSTITLQDPLSLTWRYSLNEHVISSDINSLIAKFSVFHTHIKQGLSVRQEQQQTFSASGTVVPNDNDSPPTFLEQYRDLTNVLQIALMLLTLQVLGLILFFLIMLVSVLVERQENAIALLRSRGASGRQIFGALLTQGLGLCLLGLMLGPLLAVVLVFGMGQWFFAREERSAFSFLQQDPFQVAWTLHWYALGAGAVVLIALLVAFYRIVNGNVLQLRRSITRSTHHPLWQRAYLDVIAALVALAGYVLALYVGQEATNDARSTVLVVSPLTLMAPLFLVVAAILLALRVFPLILRGGAALAGRSAGAVSMLALAQMSRTPRRVLGMILLLALATGFSFFSLVCTASQAQHIQDISDYQTGADFSGSLSIVQKPEKINGVSTIVPTTKELYADYQHIQGESIVSLGYRTDDFAYPDVVNPISLFAVDDQTFAKTALWTQQNSTQTLSVLMDELNNADQHAIEQIAIGKQNSTAIPALVDASLWNSLHLQRGRVFILKAGVTTFFFIAVDEVHHLSPLADSVESANIGDYAPPAGLLTDLDTYSLIAETKYKVEFIPRNYLWLDAQDNSSARSNVRAALTHGALQLKPFSDRRALADELATDPMYLALKGTLLLDAVAALLLSLLGCLVLSWLSVSSRLTNFALLRALGTTPWQVASTLMWEQGVLYFTALVLGVIFGALLIVTILPSIIFTGVPNGGAGMDTGAIYAWQHLFPSPIILNSSDCIPLGVLLVLCVAAVIMMVLVVSRLSTGQVLRLNED